MNLFEFDWSWLRTVAWSFFHILNLPTSWHRVQPARPEAEKSIMTGGHIDDSGEKMQTLGRKISFQNRDVFLSFIFLEIKTFNCVAAISFWLPLTSLRLSSLFVVLAYCCCALGHERRSFVSSCRSLIWCKTYKRRAKLALHRTVSAENYKVLQKPQSGVNSLHWLQEDKINMKDLFNLLSFFCCLKILRSQRSCIFNAHNWNIACNKTG